MILYICYGGQKVEDVVNNPDNLLGEVGLKFWPENGFYIFERLVQNSSELITHPKTKVISDTGRSFTISQFVEFLEKLKDNEKIK